VSICISLHVILGYRRFSKILSSLDGFSCYILVLGLTGKYSTVHTIYVIAVYYILLLHCGCLVACKATASAIELEFAVGHCASVKEIAQTMICIFDSLNYLNIKVHVLVSNLRR